MKLRNINNKDTAARLVVVSISCFLAVSCERKTHAPQERWEWYAENTEVYSPALSADGNKIVVVLKRHVSDGHEAEEMPESDLKEVEKNREKLLDVNPRYDDPRIAEIDLRTRAAEELDYGWEPEFSPDGGSIIYAHQTKPISRYRVLASTLAGNEIRVVDRRSKKRSTVASPSSGHYSEPHYSTDGSRIIYGISDATNGAYAGQVGFGMVTIADSSNVILYPKTISHGLPHLILGQVLLHDQVLAVRAIPNSESLYVADKYQVDIVSLFPTVSIVANWGIVDSLSMSSKGIARAQDNSLLVFDGSWHKLPVAHPSLTLQAYEDPGIVSPNGRWIARPTNSTVKLVDVNDGQTIKTWDNAGHAEGIAWSKDSKRIAWVAVNPTDLFQHDTLVVVSTEQVN